MNTFRYRHNRISDNRGSTLITVIVAIAFVTILTSIILGTTVVNVRMKGIDKRTKDDFYYAERSLNDIYTGLGQELAIDAAKEYEKAFEKVGNTDDPTMDFNMAETAEKEFRKQFMTKVHTKISALTAPDLEEYILPASKGHVASIGSVAFQKKDGTSPAGLTAEKADRVVIKDVVVYVEDTTKFRSTITTDIVVTIPTVDFLGTNADVTDYGLIANEGLYVEGNATIKGNVYAGVHADDRTLDDDYKETSDAYSRTPVYGGINIKNGKAKFDGNYIISKGDINLAGTNPQIEVNSSAVGAGGNLSNMWFTSMRTITNRPGGKGAVISDPVTSPTVHPTININANMFALNDLALNADNSSVNIAGNYYGYNEGGLTNILQKKTGRDDGGNSAIIVNGNKVSLNMENVQNFVLMGRAYVDFTSDTSTDASLTSTQVVPTAESVALKTNQQLYLVPPDFLEGANPIEVSRGTAHTFNINVAEANLKNWFGYDFLNTTSVPDSMHDDTKVSLTASAGGTDVWYDYLVFDEDDAVSWEPSSAAVVGVENDKTKYIVKKKPTGSGYDIVKYTKTSNEVGTHGSISSKAMFFLKIMMSENAYKREYAPSPAFPTLKSYIDEQEKTKMQPSEYRLRERIHLSMENEEYFDLQQCVVGNGSTDAHYYAKNAVINYNRIPDPEHSGETIIQSNVLDNTDGMLRYSNYKENLFKRYMLLCTKLDGREKELLETPIETSKDANNPAHWPDWKITTSTPMSCFVKESNLGTVSNIRTSIDAADALGLKPGAFGVCIAKTGNLEISATGVPDIALVAGKTFKGIAIVDGDITVANGIDINGLLLATGTITLKGNNNITYDKGLIQSRIEKEMNVIKNDSMAADWDHAIAGRDYLLIRYLTKSDGSYMYEVSPGSKIKRDRVEADYNDFMHYENWQKGEK